MQATREMQLPAQAGEEVEDLLLVAGTSGDEEAGGDQAPAAPARRSRLTLSLGVALGVAALVGCASGRSLLQGQSQSPAFARVTASIDKSVEDQLLSDFKDLPNIQGVVKKAKELDFFPRGLADTVYYRDDPAEFSAIRAQCVIDTVQAAAYLGQAVVFLYKAIDYRGLQCPDNSEVGCAVSVAGFITSVFWVASYLSLAASSCAETVNSQALCVADFTGIVADAGEIATVGAAVKEDCAAPEPTHHHHHHHEKVLRRLQDPATANATAVDVLRRLGISQDQEERNFDIAQCTFDVAQAASYVVRVVLQIRTAALSCSDPKACAVNILNIISSFAWISQFTSLAVSDCPEGANPTALCTADISDLVAASTNWAALGMATTFDCKDPDPVEELKIQPGV